MTAIISAKYQEAQAAVSYLSSDLNEKSTSAATKQITSADYQEAQAVVIVVSPDANEKSTSTTIQKIISKYSFPNAKNHSSTKADDTIVTSSDFLQPGIHKSNYHNNRRFKININPCFQRHKKTIVVGILIILAMVIVAAVVASVTSNAKMKNKINDYNQGENTTTDISPPTPILTTKVTTPKTTFPESTGALKDCKELNLKGFNEDGVYTIYPYLPLTTAVQVYCDMTTDCGGWTVFQHRKDGSVDFYLLWESYKKGFGNANGEFWLGNDYLHQLTKLGISDLYVRLEKFNGDWAYARYNNFSVADESDGYRMRVKVGSYHGNAGDSIESHGTTNTNGYKFSTSDVDNDFAPNSCAFARKGAWWYNVCTWANPNGIYGNGSCATMGTCNFWFSLTNNFVGVKTSFMMVRRLNQ